ncbi:hypothetical protein KAFR_0K02370 [Kazachstania africana CBS 2517]|uniref:Uncharacterized protein n=1 Tax=Kazachstania africana (strain ATCC 22294 / BCRC 22015 / CBS 2517 / CECT 1963 / NBRC 1671 / NRRL Y-8276) TaxID=1071382 RepID=H2B1U2_KAZAF|nr:hypothetical protein KAFR_0K02370 [Kazachstania africana CBS 2517]CCF60592.1 hypothetical protein KAFR_0K02370 [Kazachstania africana CBS 2517]
MSEDGNNRARRTTNKNINYNEKQVDAEIAKRIQQHEKDASKAGTPSKKNRKGTPVGGRTSANSSGSNSSNDSGSGNNGTKFKYHKFIHDKQTVWNFIPKLPPSFRKNSRFSNVLDLDDSFVDIKSQILFNDESTLLNVNETIYMVSEPPGEPYYIGRVVEFIPKAEFRQEIESSSHLITKYPAKYFQIRMNWYYRPRDIQERVNNPDPRLVYASLHQDICPISSYRGKCTVLHRVEMMDFLPNETESIVRPNVFFFDQLFDRYTLRYYNVYSTDKLLNYLDSRSPYLYALNKRYRYVYTEEKYPFEKVLQKYVFKNHNIKDDEEPWDQRCQICREWALSNESLCCDECGVHIHLYCMDPPLERKPNRGIVWVCFNCIKLQENTKEALDRVKREQQEESDYICNSRETLNDIATNAINSNIGYNKENCWFQYAGLHAISTMDAILSEKIFLPFPFKGSRFGSRFQWSGCNETKDTKTLIPYKDNVDERGTDKSADLLWVMDTSKLAKEQVDQYVAKCKREMPESLKMQPESCNFLDYIVKALKDNNYNVELAFKQSMGSLSRQTLKEPTFSEDELSRFEEAIKMFGPELRPVYEHVKTQPMSMIVRLFYNWKKTERGRFVRGKFHKLKEMNKKTTEEDDSIETRHSQDVPILRKRPVTEEPEFRYVDDSSFDTTRLSLANKDFQCMFCQVNYSPMWYKVTGGSDEEHIKARVQSGVNEKAETAEKSKMNKMSDSDKLGALCIRCARLWRRYAIHWQHPLEVIKKLCGTSASNYHSFLEKIVEEENINSFTLSPQTSKSKNLEWELVQDAELIVRQRLKVFEDPSTLTKMRKHSMNFHKQLAKMVTRPYNKYAYDITNMKYELNSFLKDIKKERSKHTQAPKIASNNLSTQSENVNPGLRGSEIVASSKHSRKNASSEANKTSTHKRKQPPAEKGEKLQSVTQLSTLLDVGTLKNVKMVVDKKFESVQLEKKIYEELLPKKHQREDGSEKNKVAKKVKSDHASAKNMDELRKVLDIMDDLNPLPKPVPVIFNGRNTTDFLQAYQKLEMRNENIESSVSSINKGKSSSPFGKDSEFLSEYPDKDRHFCCVCKGGFSGANDNEISCQNCGLNVHATCYGVPLKGSRSHDGVKWSQHRWLCDPCSNDLNPIISTTYNCSLCYAKELDYAGSKRGSAHACPDALKCTTDGKWVHAICSLFNDHIYYGDGPLMQPAVNVTTEVLRNKDTLCNICEMKGGGFVTCDKCPQKFHITCAQDAPGYRLLFKIDYIPDSENYIGTIIINEADKTRVVLSPKIICNKHNDDQLVSQQYHPIDSHMNYYSFIELYSKHFKRNITSNTVLTRYVEQQALRNDGKVVYDKLLSHDEISNKHLTSEPFVLKIKKLCERCSTTNNLLWFNDHLCHNCHLQKTNSRGICEQLPVALRRPTASSNEILSHTDKERLLDGVDRGSSTL